MLLLFDAFTSATISPLLGRLGLDAVRQAQVILHAVWPYLTRLTSVLETSVLACYALVGSSRRKQFLAVFLTPLAAALAFDRWYQYYRFGEIFSTYTGIVERQFRPSGAPA